MNWIDFFYGFMSGLFLFLAACGSVGYYVSRRPQKIARVMMRRAMKPGPRKAA